MATVQEKNKAVVQKYFEEYWGKGNVSVVDELCADEFVIDYPMHGPRRGKKAAKQMLLEFREVRSPTLNRYMHELWSILTSLLSLGIPEYLLPCIQVPPDRRRGLRCWPLDRWRQAHRRRVR